MIRIKNLIEQRKRLREKFSKDGFFKSEKVSASPVDIQFLKKVKDIIEKNIGSRVQLHRKLKALTDQSASEFILNLRLQKATELIKQNAASVSEITYMTGFNTPNYFAKCFRKQFGCSPTEYKQKATQ